MNANGVLLKEYGMRGARCNQEFRVQSLDFSCYKFNFCNKKQENEGLIIDK